MVLSRVNLNFFIIELMFRENCKRDFMLWVMGCEGVVEEGYVSWVF